MDPTRQTHVPYGPRFGDSVRQELSIQRRTFMALVSGGLLAAPLAAEGSKRGKSRGSASSRLIPARRSHRRHDSKRSSKVCATSAMPTGRPLPLTTCPQTAGASDFQNSLLNVCASRRTSSL
jgi:hypothetical protein